MNIGDLTITSLETITAFELASEGGGYLFTLDELQNASIANTQEDSEVTGKGGRRISTIKKNKGVTISGANGLISGGLLAAQTGGELKVGDGTSTVETYVEWRDYVKASTTGTGTQTSTITLTYSPKDGKLDGLFVKNDDGSIGEELELTDDYTISGTTVTLTAAVTDGAEFVALYQRKVYAAEVLENLSDKYSKKCSLYVDAFAEDKCGVTYHVQFYLPKVSFSGEFTLEFGGDQAVHNFEGTAEAGGCSAGSTGSFWTYTVFGKGDSEN